MVPWQGGWGEGRGGEGVGGRRGGGGGGKEGVGLSLGVGKYRSGVKVGRDGVKMEFDECRGGVRVRFRPPIQTSLVLILVISPHHYHSLPTTHYCSSSLIITHTHSLLTHYPSLIHYSP